MFLSVTPLREFQEAADETLFLGPWCVPFERRGELARMRHRFVPDPFQDLARFREANAYCRSVSEHFFGELSAYLNRVHGTTHDSRYWRLLLDPWLRFNIEQAYDHYAHVEAAFRLGAELHTILLDPSCYETPRDTGDWVRLKQRDRFHLQLFSQILARRLPLSETRPLPLTPAEPLGGRKAFAKRVLARAIGSLTALGLGEVLLSQLEMPREELMKLTVGSRFKALPYLGELPESARPEPVFDARRLGLRDLPARNEFERTFAACLPWQLPTILLEGYAEARRATLSNLPRAPKIFFSAVGWHYFDSSKFAAAECAARGSRLWGFQHGGAYGMYEQAPAEVIERFVCDRYHTWGWSRTDPDPRLRDLPAPILSRGGPANPGEEILFVSTILDLHNIRLVRDSNGAGAYACLDRQARFLRALPEPARGSARSRVYHLDFGWRQRERLSELVPGIRFDDSGLPFAQRVREARLVVVDCPSTPMLEALAADVPCVMTWSPDAWTFRPSAQPFFDALRAAGILSDSPEDAAAQAALAYADPQGWWNEPRRKAARLALSRTFALCSPDWVDAWLAEIRDGLEELRRPESSAARPTSLSERKT